MCTSNLENLNVYSIELTGVNASHSFLGDLLLAAKYERKHIKNNLRKDILGICTDIKYRFADLGDIIRGKDIEDWWFENSTKFWEAMHCASKAGGIECGGDPTPEDYIPQRLRWLSEWADNYCKMVKTDYKSMSDECKTCKKNGANFAKGSPDCTKYIMKIIVNTSTQSIVTTPMCLKKFQTIINKNANVNSIKHAI
ncbi:hypothetical protein PFUGPA_00383 [Plasmodium falciparum Palo Alto/Uganda]|uniref:Duffy-antigen binding domain-containing protein n=1 Tax=Plasmodium falciparum (isolate Palo Alto / Uganda) TaxID=57270 RepID=W4J7L8_PLAFP|nr:hypothetical protein PFUGPA_00383 [Plasmodium falciparum Palo Alto/Uganda]